MAQRSPDWYWGYFEGATNKFDYSDHMRKVFTELLELGRMDVAGELSGMKSAAKIFYEYLIANNKHEEAATFRNIFGYVPELVKG